VSSNAEFNEFGYPVGGALPRKTKFGRLAGVPVFGDVIEVIPERDMPDLLKQHEGLCQFIPPEGIYDQDDNSCASEAANQGNSVARVMAGLPWVLFNPLFNYHHVCGGVDGGSSLDDNVADLMLHGSCPEAVWSRANGWRKKPSEEAYRHGLKYRLLEAFDLRTIDDMRTALLKGFTVYYGSKGHAKLFTRMLDMNTGRYVNSWGNWWEDHGFGTEAFRSVGMVTYGVFAMRCSLDTGENLPGGK